MAGDGLDRHMIVAGFRIMGRHLFERDRIAEICLLGDSALLFLVDWRTRIEGVDVAIRGEHGPVIAARDEAARRLGLSRGWLNEGATHSLAPEASGAMREIDAFPSTERPALRVLAADPDYLLALKVLAIGERSMPDDRDFQDAVRLAASLGLATASEIAGSVWRYFPGRPLSWAIEMRLDELAQASRQRRAEARAVAPPS